MSEKVSVPSSKSDERDSKRRLRSIKRHLGTTMVLILDVEARHIGGALTRRCESRIRLTMRA